MKTLTVCLLLMIGCHKSGKPEQSLAGAQGTSSDATPPKPVVTGAPPSPAAATGSAGSATVTPAPTFGLPNAVDEFNKRFASIWALPEKQRFNALCPVAKELAARAEAMAKMQSAPPNWEAAIGDLWMALSDTQSACADQAKETGHLNPDQQELVDYGKAEHVRAVHDNFVAAAKLVPGTQAVN